MTESKNPTVQSSCQSGTTIFQLLTEIDRTYNTTLLDSLNSPITNILEQLENFAAQNDETQSRLLAERLTVAVDQKEVVEKEQAGFCERLDMEVNLAVYQWKEETANLRQVSSDLLAEKRRLTTNLEKTDQSLALLNPRKSRNNLKGERAFTDGVWETVRKLERFVDDRNEDLASAHRELEDSSTDIERICKHLTALNKENAQLVRNSSILVEQLSELSSKEMSLQLQLDATVKRGAS